jgi:hypothetical protein
MHVEAELVVVLLPEAETSVWHLERGDGVSKGGVATWEGRGGGKEGEYGGEGGEGGPWSGVSLDLQFIKQRISLLWYMYLFC